jgi:hypothetical protein
VFVSCIQTFRASRQESNDLSEANLFITNLNWLISFLCSELWSLIRFVSSSMSPDISKTPSLPNLIKWHLPHELGRSHNSITVALRSTHYINVELEPNANLVPKSGTILRYLFPGSLGTMFIYNTQTPGIHGS